MARYDYRCPACATQFEVEHPMAERPEVRCPNCNTLANQVFGASSIVFKGSGFYNTDQRGGGSQASTPATSAPDTEKSSGTSTSTSSPSPSGDATSTGSGSDTSSKSSSSTSD